HRLLHPPRTQHRDEQRRDPDGTVRRTSVILAAGCRRRGFFPAPVTSRTPLRSGRSVSVPLIRIAGRGGYQLRGPTVAHVVTLCATALASEGLVSGPAAESSEWRSRRSTERRCR